MSTVIKDLGAVSAYAYAVEKGYTGTEAEFAELMADYANVGQRAEDAAGSAMESKTAAQTAATTATTKASEAATSAQTATTKAGEATTAAGTATTAKNDAVAAKTAAETAQGKAEDAQAAAESVAESIPSDYSQLSEDVSDLKEGLKEIADKPKAVLNGDAVSLSFKNDGGGYIDYRDGSIIASSNFNHTDFVNLEMYGSISYKRAKSTGNDPKTGIAFFDASKAYVSGVQSMASQASQGYADELFTVAIPTEARYAKFSYYSDTATYGEFEVIGISKFKELSDNVDGIEGELNIEETQTYTYGDITSETTAYIKPNGQTESYSDAYTSDYIAVLPSSFISYTLAYIHGASVAIAFYDANKTFISAVTADSGSRGLWVGIIGSVSTPINSAYMRVSMSKGTKVGAVPANSQQVAYITSNSLKSVVERLIPEVGSPWNGKNWCAFGTSITDTSYMNAETGEVTGKYVPFLAELSGAIVTNKGIAGGTLGRSGIHGGSGNILDRILSTDLSSYDLITIEGFVNDFACAITIGDIGDTANTTFCGALHQALAYCLENSHAEVILITESTGKEYTLQGGTTVSYEILEKNSLNVYQQAYNDAMIKMGQYYGVHVIDAGGMSQINQYHPEFIIDQIHHTSLGGEQYAKTIWEELKQIQPLKVT